MFHVMAALTKFERDLISERTQAGLEAARARGRKGGRPAVTKKMSVANLERAKELYASQAMSVTEIMKRTGFRSRTTFYKYVVNGGEANHLKGSVFLRERTGAQFSGGSSSNQALLSR
ncbi:recombinase family protein [Ktedonospora formicarum]|uniref:Resolvase/invertase-type recombinase catalytic domain-containing protein n=1 Tax=Ktedonospora formicarum TaxID=2778364 RepID=A0A8J3MZ24_9CHLR|nr:recombinase family protein [Ktedonospora formicarum]GHO50330.1 hypothetical protein KSX_84930 [Ktedonospora formicarum]